jgi:hypothetical protein
MLRRFSFALAFLLFAAPACEEAKPTGNKLNVQVNLPAPPVLPPLPAPTTGKYDGNIFSVAGIKRSLLLRRAPKVMETPQTIKGYIVKFYENPCDKNAKDCLGKEPHFWISDTPNGTDTLVVVPSWKDENNKLMKMYEVGKQYDFKGRFTIQAINGFTDTAGLLDLECPPEICPVDELQTGPGGLPVRRGLP